MTTSDGSTKPLDVQIGGDHYKSMAIQPMEYSMANKLDACQHTIIKYVTRFRGKGGIQDLEKAKHCIELLIHFERQAATVKESLTVHPVHPATFDHIDPADVDIASAIDDDSERMQAIGQNGNGGEHYELDEKSLQLKAMLDVVARVDSVKYNPLRDGISASRCPDCSAEHCPCVAK